MDKRRLDMIKKNGTLNEYNEALKSYTATEALNNKTNCQCNNCKGGILHKSDCVVHNEPAEPNGECNCL